MFHKILKCQQTDAELFIGKKSSENEKGSDYFLYIDNGEFDLVNGKVKGTESNNPDDAKDAPDYDIDVTLTSATLSTISKVASINSLPDYGLVTEDGVINFVALDKKDDTSDVAKEPVGESNADFKMYFRAENLKLMEGDYNVRVSRHKISTFRHQTKDLQYWVTLEQDSEYND